jgi:2'-5' RNA ligase
MNVDPNGAPLGPPLRERLNLFALVSYVPDPLGRFLDDLRRELVPHDNPRAHVSILPPRPLMVDWSVASREVRALTNLATPFDIELLEVKVFPVTDVIYLELGSGASELRSMHNAMCQGALEFREPFSYHPHLTLAQEIANQDVEATRATAVRRWHEYRGARRFRVERVVLVQNTRNGCWIDLAEYSLGAVAVR